MMISSHSCIRSRRALTTVAVLVCLIVITLCTAALVKTGLTQRTQVRSQEHRLQAEWLAESGLDRALARLAADGNYSGENWSIGAQDLSLPKSPSTGQRSGAAAEPAATIVIAVDRVAQQANRRRIRVQADYGLDPPARFRHTKQVLINLAPKEAGVAP
jgi:Tfp pilus assembly protein PilX